MGRLKKGEQWEGKWKADKNKWNEMKEEIKLLY